MPAAGRWANEPNETIVFMCGIVGQFNLDGAPVSERRLDAMCEAIVHRGPDDQGLHVAGAVGLGMRRLSIIDLAGGHQPMHGPDGSFIVFNGEIYNYRELRAKLEGRGYRFQTASDTESILHAYREYGESCLEHLNGMFAVAIWDGPRHRLFVARDRLGIKPLYLRITPSTISLASEIKALLVDGSPRSMDEDACAYYLRYGYVAAPGTLFRGISKLPPGHLLTATRDQVRIAPYWTLRYEPGEESEEACSRQLLETFDRCVHRQLVADVPLGSFLSGGLDSSSIVSSMTKVTGTAVSTYSIGFADRDVFYSELDDARTAARHYRTLHREIVVQPDAADLIPRLVRHLDEPLADSSFVVTYLVSKLAAESVKVILSGVGGDELFGGYRRYLGPQLSRWYRLLPHAAQRQLRRIASTLPVDRGSRFRNYARLGRAYLMAADLPAFEQYDAAVRVLAEDSLGRVAPPLNGRRSGLDAARRDLFERLGGQPPETRMMHLDLSTSLPESLLLLTDKMTMAASIEGRVPFLDHELVELAARIPAHMKIKGRRLRHIQKTAMRTRVPSTVLTKRKRGFGFPIGAWFRHELRELTGDLLSPTRLGRAGLLDADAVAQLVREHREQRHDHSDALLALVTFELWRDQWGL